MEEVEDARHYRLDTPPAPSYVTTTLNGDHLMTAKPHTPKEPGNGRHRFVVLDDGALLAWFPVDVSSISVAREAAYAYRSRINGNPTVEERDKPLDTSYDATTGRAAKRSGWAS